MNEKYFKAKFDELEKACRGDNTVSEYKALREKFHSLAEEGYTPALARYGFMGITLAHTESEFRSALHILEDALNKGAYLAAYYLAKFYENPSSFQADTWDIDEEMEEHYLKIGADHDEPRCCEMYAEFITGKEADLFRRHIQEGRPGICPNIYPYETLFHCAKVAADNGYQSSAFMTANAYLDERGTRFDLEKAEKYIRIAGSDDELYRLTMERIEHLKQQLAENPELNPALLFPKADKGDPDAAFTLGFLYMNGDILPFNHEKAADYFTLVVEKGRSMRLDYLCIQAEAHKDSDIYKRLIDVFEIMANRGIGYAANALAMIYRLGEDEEKEVKWLKKAVAAEYPEAFNYLAVYYKLGAMGFEKSPEKFIEALKKGTSLGEVECCRALGQAYLDGEFVEKNLMKGEDYLRIAAAQSGLEETRALRDRCLDELSKKDKLSRGDDASARYYAKLSADGRKNINLNDLAAACRSYVYTSGDDDAMLDKLRYMLRYIIESGGREKDGSLCILGEYMEFIGWDEQALEVYKLAEKKKDSNYRFYKACRYLTGLGVEKDPEKALKLFLTGYTMKDKLCDAFIKSYRRRSGVENLGSLDEEIALPIVRQIKFGAEA